MQSSSSNKNTTVFELIHVQQHTGSFLNCTKNQSTVFQFIRICLQQSNRSFFFFLQINYVNMVSIIPHCNFLFIFRENNDGVPFTTFNNLWFYKFNYSSVYVGVDRTRECYEWISPDSYASALCTFLQLQHIERHLPHMVLNVVQVRFIFLPIYGKTPLFAQCLITSLWVCLLTVLCFIYFYLPLFCCLITCYCVFQFVHACIILIVG